MGWQESFANVFGPGLLGGMCFGDLCQVLRDNRVRVHPLRLTRLLSALQCSLMTSLQKRLEETRFASKWRHVEVSAPVTDPSAIRFDSVSSVGGEFYAAQRIESISRFGKREVGKSAC